MAKPTKNLKTLKKGRATALNTVNVVNTKAIELTEELIEGSVATGVKYQKLAVNALKKTEPIMAKNVDIAFDTVEALYDQMISANTRLQKLFGIQKTVKNAKATLWNTYKSTSKLAEKNMDDATNILKAAANEIEESMEVITEKIKQGAKTAEKQIKATAELVTDAAASTVKAPKSKKAKKAKKAAKKAMKATAAKAKKVAKKASKKVVKAKPSAKKTARKATKRVKPVAKKTVRKATPKRTTKVAEKFEDTVTVITSKRAAAAKRANTTTKRATKTTRKRVAKK